MCLGQPPRLCHSYGRLEIGDDPPPREVPSQPSTIECRHCNSLPLLPYTSKRCKSPRHPSRSRQRWEPAPLTIPGSNGSPLLAVGDWQGSSTLGIFRSALSKLHEHFDLCRDSYIHDCPSCRNPKEGCNLHTVSRFWRKGNVIRSPKFKTHLSLQEHYVEEKYESKSTMAFQPFELRLIRDHLVTSCEPEKLMLWTLMMTGIRLFL